ncbi:uncharacterized protein LOC105696817 isoform X2 [Orussus abietinus]|nr:uncharacterized protein LOC105696817 isoform X2 [Orussus abietinus]
MAEPVLVEESVPSKLSTVLKEFIECLPKNIIHHDYLMALVIVLLSEVGFRVDMPQEEVEESRWCQYSSRLLRDWKSQESGTYRINFHLHSIPTLRCRFVATPNGDVLILNFLPSETSNIGRSMAVQTLKYVNPYSSDINDRFLNLKEFSQRLKNQLATPILVYLLTEVGLPSPSLLGLPVELKLRILSFLDKRSIGRLARTCKEFRDLSQNHAVR